MWVPGEEKEGSWCAGGLCVMIKVALKQYLRIKETVSPDGLGYLDHETCPLPAIRRRSSKCRKRTVFLSSTKTDPHDPSRASNLQRAGAGDPKTSDGPGLQQDSPQQYSIALTWCWLLFHF